LTGLVENLAPLKEAFDKAITAKNDAIKEVLLKDEADKATITKDYEAATAEIDAKEILDTKTGEWEDAKRKLDVFLGRVTVDSGIADDAATGDKLENKKNETLAKGGSGKLAIATKNLQDATDKQAKLKTALDDSATSYEHWKVELAAEEAKVAAPADTDMKNAKNAVDALTTDYGTKNTNYLAKKAEADVARAKAALLKAEVDRV
jgi:hypothetical protein